ncbi:hypothetical protein [Bacteroides sp.]|uniref:hypothetical protein n=1 Tax=Bacteroides sp. TaxID=29523 RepID=UPI002633AB64|nr:hypothetical protein [Bacteroides sp.]MDD3037268.1 hypothetical protein [Bacteroides sp.]
MSRFNNVSLSVTYQYAMEMIDLKIDLNRQLKQPRKVLTENRDLIIGIILHHVNGKCVVYDWGGSSQLGGNTA